MLKIKNLTVGYKNKALLEGLEFEEESGRLVALLGRNGTGKSTLLRTIIGLLKPLEGDVIIDGHSIFSIRPHVRAKLIAFVSTESVRVAHLRVWDVVAMGRSPYNSFTGALSEWDAKIVKECIEQVGMSGFVEATVDRLSDGERQRIMIARALAQEAKMIILDEPTAFLDLPNRLHIMRLLKELAHQQGKLILLSTHELNLACDIADRIWVVDQGKLIRGSVDDNNVTEAIRKMMK